METALTASLSYPLEKQGISTSATIFANLGTPALIEHAVKNGEGLLAKDGPFVVETGKHTGRSAFTSPTCLAVRSPNTGSRCA